VHSFVLYWFALICIPFINLVSPWFALIPSNAMHYFDVHGIQSRLQANSDDQNPEQADSNKQKAEQSESEQIATTECKAGHIKTARNNKSNRTDRADRDNHNADQARSHQPESRIGQIRAQRKTQKQIRCCDVITPPWLVGISVWDSATFQIW
jgi:hypothetical protein